MAVLAHWTEKSVRYENRQFSLSVLEGNKNPGDEQAVSRNRAGIEKTGDRPNSEAERPHQRLMVCSEES